MITANDILTDKDVAKMLGINYQAFQRFVRKGFPAGSVDIMAAKPVFVGSVRRWLRADVERVLRDRITVKAAND